MDPQVYGFPLCPKCTFLLTDTKKVDKNDEDYFSFLSVCFWPSAGRFLDPESIRTGDLHVPLDEYRNHNDANGHDVGLV